MWVQASAASTADIPELPLRADRHHVVWGNIESHGWSSSSSDGELNAHSESNSSSESDSTAAAGAALEHRIATIDCPAAGNSLSGRKASRRDIKKLRRWSIDPDDITFSDHSSTPAEERDERLLEERKKDQKSKWRPFKQKRLRFNKHMKRLYELIDSSSGCIDLQSANLNLPSFIMSDPETMQKLHQRLEERVKWVKREVVRERALPLGLVDHML